MTGKKETVVQNFFLSLPVQALDIAPPWMWQEAASSWFWLSAWRPWHILLLAFAAVCLAELLVLRYMGGVSKWSRLLPTVLGANAVCFLLATVVRWINFSLPLYGLSLDGFEAAFDEGPFYTFNIVLIAAVVAKLLLLCFLFRKDTTRRVSRAIVLTGANVVIIGLMAYLERLLCVGHYV